MSSNDKQQRVLVIDNGSYECRVGWGGAPKPELVFRNVLTKIRKDRKKEPNTPEPDGGNAAPLLQIGNDITNIEAVRLHLKSPFDRNVITNWNHQEKILDYVFTNMGYDGRDSIDTPLVLTEVLSNPNYCREQMNELLFELYGVPAISYGIDALFSWRYNKHTSQCPDALIVSFGYSATHVIPVLNGQMQVKNVRRLNVGGFNILTYLFRLMQIKYPVHLNAITLSRIESLVHNDCKVAVDYQEELLKWADVGYYDSNVMKIQLPYNIGTQPQQTVEQKQEKRRELAQRLIDMNAKRMRDKLAEDEQQLVALRRIEALHEENKMFHFQRALQRSEIADLDDLRGLIRDVSQRIENSKQRLQNGHQAKPQRAQQPTLPKPPDGLSEAVWLDNLRAKRLNLLKEKQERHAQRQEQSKRHTHAAQERMRIISTLARAEKRRRKHDKEDEDDFGMNDNDWDVYKRINRDNDDSESEAENEKILECEQILRHYDPSFTEGSAQPVAITAENYQLHFGVEAIRVPEVLFQPSLIGCTEMGLADLINYVLKLFQPDEQQRMVDNVCLTGGCAQFRGLKERLERELLALRPFQSTFSIRVVDEPLLSAWQGASKFTQSENFPETYTTRRAYDEFGGEYLKEHNCSNFYYATPKP